jgi:REP element-mobilizing transposase RayT
VPQPRLEIEGGCYHTVSVTKGRSPFFADKRSAEILLDSLHFISQSFRAHILAYVVMPDHLHLLLAIRDGYTLSGVMHSLKRFTVQRINDETGHVGSIWQQGYHDRLISDEEQLRAAVEYIHKNPVAAGIVALGEDYPFSSAHPDASTDIEAFFGA